MRRTIKPTDQIHVTTYSHYRDYDGTEHGYKDSEFTITGIKSVREVAEEIGKRGGRGVAYFILGNNTQDWAEIYNYNHRNNGYSVRTNRNW